MCSLGGARCVDVVCGTLQTVRARRAPITDKPSGVRHSVLSGAASDE